MRTQNCKAVKEAHWEFSPQGTWNMVEKRRWTYNKVNTAKHQANDGKLYCKKGQNTAWWSPTWWKITFTPMGIFFFYIYIFISGKRVVFNEQLIYKLSGPFEKSFLMDSTLAKIGEKKISSSQSFWQFRQTGLLFNIWIMSSLIRAERLLVK